MFNRNKERNEGIEAIIFLQALVGIHMDVRDAETGWDSMCQWERAQTMMIYRAVKFAPEQTICECFRARREALN